MPHPLTQVGSAPSARRSVDERKRTLRGADQASEVRVPTGPDACRKRRSHRDPILADRLNPELGDQVPLRLMREDDLGERYGKCRSISSLRNVIVHHLETVRPEIRRSWARRELSSPAVRSESNGSRIEAVPRPLFRLSRYDAWAIPECAFVKENGAFSLRRFNDPTGANFDRSRPRGRLRRLCPFLCPPTFKIGHNWGGIDSNCDRGGRG